MYIYTRIYAGDIGKKELVLLIEESKGGIRPFFILALRLAFWDFVLVLGRRVQLHWPFVLRLGTQGATLHAKFYAKYFPPTVRL